MRFRVEPSGSTGTSEVVGPRCPGDEAHLTLGPDQRTWHTRPVVPCRGGGIIIVVTSVVANPLATALPASVPSVRAVINPGLAEPGSAAER